MSEIIIKVKGGASEIKTNTDELVEVNETADGVNFVLKGNLTIQFIDPYMPSSIKQIIKNTADHFDGKKLIFEPDNPRRPVMVIAD
jgi:hypothetical protein